MKYCIVDKSSYLGLSIEDRKDFFSMVKENSIETSRHSLDKASFVVKCDMDVHACSTKGLSCEQKTLNELKTLMRSTDWTDPDDI